MSPSKCPLVIFFLVTLCIATLPATAQQSAGDPSAALNSLEQTAHTTASDIAHLRIDRWKVDSKSKNDAQADRDSLERNLTNALPELIGKVRRAPTDLTANFELYRNLEVLSMIFSRFAETTGAFGGKDEYSALTNDVAGLDSARKTFTARMESLTASAQAELTQYRSQAKATQAAAPPPKKIVIDDSEPEKPKAASKKKKSSKPASADASTPSTTSASAPKQ